MRSQMLRVVADETIEVSVKKPSKFSYTDVLLYYGNPEIEITYQALYLYFFPT